MTMEALPSKWGHNLDDAQITMMIEPYPGTQTIFEVFNGDCNRDFEELFDVDEWDEIKTYPPNSTVYVLNNCSAILMFGNITKLVVESNTGSVIIDSATDNRVYIEDVVVKSSNNILFITNEIGSFEIQDLGPGSLTQTVGKIRKHIDVKRVGEHAELYIYYPTVDPADNYDFWVGQNCGDLQVWSASAESD